MPRRLSLLPVAFLAAALVAGCGSKSSTTTTTTPATTPASSSSGLVGTVGPGFTITLTKGGSPVASLTAGTYKMVVNDEAAVHNFHLFGPGVDKATGVQGTGSVAWTVKLSKGSYTYRCDIHFASGMIGHFTVK